MPGRGQPAPLIRGLQGGAGFFAVDIGVPPLPDVVPESGEQQPRQGQHAQEHGEFQEQG